MGSSGTRSSASSRSPAPTAGWLALVGGMAMDITDRMRAEEALVEADRRKDEFLATLRMSCATRWPRSATPCT